MYDVLSQAFLPFHAFVIFDNDVIDEVTQNTHQGVMHASNLSWFLCLWESLKESEYVKGFKIQT